MLIDERYCLIVGPSFRFLVSICNSWCSKSKFPEAMVKRIYMVSVCPTAHDNLLWQMRATPPI